MENYKKRSNYGINIIAVPIMTKNPTKRTERSFWSCRSFFSYTNFYYIFL